MALFYASEQKQIFDSLALWNSKLITYKPGEQSTSVNVNIAGARKLFLVVTDGGDGNSWDHADWIEPTLICKTGKLQLTDIKWLNATAGWGSASIDNSVGGNKLIVDNKEYSNGIGTHAASIIEYDLPEGYDTFSSIAGLDKECINHIEGATVRFHVFTTYPTGSLPKDSAKITLEFSKLGFNGRCKVRDLWAKKDLGEFNNEISTYVKKHGVKLLKISRE